jgi:hypothetical protein
MARLKEKLRLEKEERLARVKSNNKQLYFAKILIFFFKSLKELNLNNPLLLLLHNLLQKLQLLLLNVRSPQVVPFKSVYTMVTQSKPLSNQRTLCAQFTITFHFLLDIKASV